jgi:stage III sporulation protein AG
MITYKDTQAVKSVFANEKSSDERDVKGVIVTASGASSPVVKNNIMNAVAAVFDIPIQNVMVFEKNEVGYK